MVSNLINLLWGITLLAVICSSDQINYSCNSTVSCGCSSKSASIARIVGGETANVATWNWVVFMTIANEFSCVGSILSPSWIITAAHCVESYRASQIIVYAGSNDRLSGTQLRSVSQVIAHPSYNNTTFVNDIALLQLKFPLNMQDRAVGQICIPPVSSIVSKAGEWPPIGTKVSLYGRVFLTVPSMFMIRSWQWDGADSLRAGLSRRIFSKSLWRLSTVDHRHAKNGPLIGRFSCVPVVQEVSKVTFVCPVALLDPSNAAVCRYVRG